MEVKHPVSQLQELMAQQHKGLPLYRISDISTTVSTTEPSFHCVVRADTITGTGVALSKQAAKKKAALHALEQLGYTDNDARNSVTTSTKIISHKSATTTIVNYNAVGKLNELVAQQRFPYPVYNESGFNECGEFVMICKLLNHQCQGCGSTKKTAKQVAAHSMLKWMEENIVGDSHLEPSVLNNTDISDEIIIRKYNELTISDISRITQKDTADGTEINYNIYKEEKSNDKEFSERDLNKMSGQLKTLNVSFTVDVIQRNPYMLVLTFQDEGNTTVVGTGDSYNKAYFDTLQNALKITSVW